jgi:hypothetical protein
LNRFLLLFQISEEDLIIPMSRLIKYISLVVMLELILCLGITTQVQAAGAITITVQTGKFGDVITIAGSGWTNGEEVSISFEGNPANDTYVFANTTTGRFSKAFTIPSSTAGEHAITAEGSISGDSAVAYFTVSPNIILSKSSGEPGTSLTVTGYGFEANETNIQLTFNNLAVGTPKTASALGYWINSLTIPVISAGTYTISATGNNSSTASASFIATVTPRITSTKTSGAIGTAVTVNGTGFSAGESGITVTLGSKPVGSTISASASGAWSSTFNIPVIPGGSHIVDASGSTTLASAVNDLSLTVTPTVSINPAATSPGSTVTVEGNGFGANESVTISFDTTDISPVIKADSDGTWSTTITIPAVSASTKKIYARGTSTPKTAANADIKVGAGISINKSSGMVGSVITVSGSGFAAKESGLNIIFDGAKTAVTTAAGDTGIWSASFTIPNAAGGEHKIDAEGKTTTAVSVADVIFTVTPDISMDKTEGMAGTTVSFAATGFAAAESGITITYDGKSLGPKITADAIGAWKATVTIPPSSSGPHTLQVNGSVTATPAKGSFTFEVTSNLYISPSEGFIGSAVNVSGSGFTANSNLRFMFDNIELNVGIVTTDKNGNFSKSLIIPRAKAGDHVIRIQDNQSNSMEVVFVMESEAPPSPNITRPEYGETLGLFGNVTPSLEWSKVTDPSGVSYNLQLDSDPEFGNPLIELSGITVTKYTLKKNEALPRGQYYWRVQAVDGASNTSEWTDPVLLISGKVSPLLFILIVVLVVAAIGVGLFFLIRWMQRRKQKASQPQMAPEIVIPEVVNAEYKQIEGDKKALPWRLALPQAPQPARGSKSSISSEDQARLKVIIDFAKSVPLAEPGANTNWLVDLAESTTGLVASPALYSQLVKGELQLRYEPAWMRHPTYIDLQTLLEGQPLLQDLNTFVDSVNNTAADAEAALGEIYQAIAAEVRWDIFANGGWVYISAVYMDSYNWFQGKYLKEPSDRDYSVKAETLASGGDGFGLYAEANTPFAGLLIQAGDEKEAQSLRALHLNLRRDFRHNERIKMVVTSIIQLEVQRNRLVNAFKQFNRLNPS